MKKIRIRYIDRNQVWLLILVWILIFSMPLLAGEFDDRINWDHIFRIWKETIIVFVVFLVNRLVLLPKLFFKQKRVAYLLIVFFFIVIASSSVFLVYQHPFKGNHFPEPPEHGISSRNKMPPGMPPKIPKGEPPPKMPLPWLNPSREPHWKMPILPYSNVFIMSLLIVGFDTGLVFFTQWNKSEKNKLKTEKENMHTQMAFLKNQISPHFFMNTLNNIHALVDIDSEEAKKSIIWLSELMNYMLYESETSYISLSKEIEFIRSYVELMRLRFTDDLDLELDIPQILPTVKIPPLLTISFIENAFKHGIKHNKQSYIHIQVNASEKDFAFRIENSLYEEIKRKSKGGIGIANTRKRLELIYGNNFQLSINSNSNKFVVFLKVPV